MVQNETPMLRSPKVSPISAENTATESVVSGDAANLAVGQLQIGTFTSSRVRPTALVEKKGPDLSPGPTPDFRKELRRSPGSQRVGQFQFEHPTKGVVRVWIVVERLVNLRRIFVV